MTERSEDKYVEMVSKKRAIKSQIQQLWERYKNNVKITPDHTKEKGFTAKLEGFGPIDLCCNGDTAEETLTYFEYNFRRYVEDLLLIEDDSKLTEALAEFKKELFQIIST